MSLLPGVVLLVGWSRVEIVQRVVIRSNVVQSLLGPVSISPTRVGVHHGRWNAAGARRDGGGQDAWCATGWGESVDNSTWRVSSRLRRERGPVQQVQRSYKALRSESHRSMATCCTCCTVGAGVLREEVIEFTPRIIRVAHHEPPWPAPGDDPALRARLFVIPLDRSFLRGEDRNVEDVQSVGTEEFSRSTGRGCGSTAQHLGLRSERSTASSSRREPVAPNRPPRFVLSRASPHAQCPSGQTP